MNCGPVAVVEGEHDRLRRQRAAFVPGFLDLFERHRLVAVLVRASPSGGGSRAAPRRVRGRARRPGASPSTWYSRIGTGPVCGFPVGLRGRVARPADSASARRFSAASCRPRCRRRRTAETRGDVTTARTATISTAATSRRRRSRRRRRRRGRTAAARGRLAVPVVCRSRHPRSAIMVGKGAMHESRDHQRERLAEALRRRLPGAGARSPRPARDPVYLVGGAVRDLLLGRGRADIDLVVEGDAGGAGRPRSAPSRSPTHERFGTAKVELDGHEIDIAGARSETYPRAGRAAGGRAGREHRGRPGAARLHGQRDGDPAARRAAR